MPAAGPKRQTWRIGDRVVFRFDIAADRWGRGVVTKVDKCERPEVEGEQVVTIRSDFASLTHVLSSLQINPESVGPT